VHVLVVRWSRHAGDREVGKGGAMKAQVGDKLVIMGRRVGEHQRDAEILEVRGKDGGPPYLVRWSDDGHVSLVQPGPDALVQHIGRTSTAAA
jgi:hypothetical protein